MADYSDWLRWRFELAGFYDRPVEAQHRQLSSWDGQLTVWQIRQGGVTIEHAGRRLAAGPGDWVLIAPGTARRHRFSPDASIRSIRCIVLDPSGQPPGIGLDPQIVAGGESGLESSADALAAVLPRSSRWYADPLPPAAWAALQAAVLRWSATALARLGVSASTPPADARVVAAQRALLARRSPAALPWADLRSATGLSRPQLDRLFRQHCGGSVRAWYEGRLLTDACRALEDRREAVKAVATRLGFGDASHFCRWFRLRTGSAPDDWRRRDGV